MDGTRFIARRQALRPICNRCFRVLANGGIEEVFSSFPPIAAVCVASPSYCSLYRYIPFSCSTLSVHGFWRAEDSAEQICTPLRPTSTAYRNVAVCRCSSSSRRPSCSVPKFQLHQYVLRVFHSVAAVRKPRSLRWAKGTGLGLTALLLNIGPYARPSF